MTFRQRPYRDEDDLRAFRYFLREAFLLNNRHEHCWHPTRLDHWLYHMIPNCNVVGSLESAVHFWETPDNRQAAIVNRIAGNHFRLHFHPQYRSQELEAQVIDYVVSNLFLPDKKTSARVTLLVDDNDDLRRTVLASSGFVPTGTHINHWWRDLDGPLPKRHTVPGFTIRPMEGEDDYPARSWASWTAFHPDEPDAEYDGWEWYRNLVKARSYRSDLDIVAVSKDDNIASFCTALYDDATDSAVTVFVGSAKEFHRRGLGSAVYIENLHRLKEKKVTRVFADAESPEADAFYRKMLGCGPRGATIWALEPNDTA